jgi:hypothetical protein
MLEAETTPSETSQLSDISSVTVPNFITADLDSEKPTAPPGFHWLGDKPMLEKKRFSGFPGQFHT